jgi:SAM-dependent methyltransferase
VRIGRARERLPDADIRQGNGESLPWADGSFDLVLQSTVFTSILDGAMRATVAGEMARVLSPSGAILWYDFFRDNPRNPDVRGVGSDEIRRLFPGLDVSLRRITLAPPIARRVAPRSWVGAATLEAMRALNTHYLGMLRHPTDRVIQAQGER